MPYHVDYAKAPLTLLLEEFNLENGTTFTYDDVTFFNFVASSDRPGESSIMMSAKNPEVAIGSVKLHYVRMDLAYIFSLSGLIAKDNDFVMPTDLPVVNDRLLSNLFRRYKLPFNTNEFDFTVTDDTLYVTANNKNLVYKGTVRLDTYINPKVSAPPAAAPMGLACSIVEIIRVNPRA